MEQAFQRIAKDALAQDTEDAFPDQFPDPISLRPGQNERPRQGGDNCGC